MIRCGISFCLASCGGWFDCLLARRKHLDESEPHKGRQCLQDGARSSVHHFAHEHRSAGAKTAVRLLVIILWKEMGQC